MSDSKKWYGDAGNFWRFRAIHSRHGLDFVPNRGGFDEGQKTEERVKFIDGVMKSKEFKSWVAVQRGDSSGVYTIDDGKNHFRATNNASYGYTYLWAWEEEIKEN
jgi:hypothetical protein